MNTEKLTEKSIEAIKDAQNLCTQHHNQEVQQEHLLLALVRQDEGLIPNLLNKMGVDVDSFKRQLEARVASFPQISGSREADRIYVAVDLDDALNEAESQAQKMKDEYTSVEHLMLGLIMRPNDWVRDILNQYNINVSTFLKALQATRGSARVTSETPEDTYDVLNKYGQDLGLEIHYNTALLCLIKEDKAVTGIYAKTEKGIVRYNASKGVIVCTGGYSLNMDMLKALQPETVKMININYSYPGSQGDGIKACLWAGAVMDETHGGMLFDRGAVAPDQVGCQTPGALFWMGSQPFLKVGLDGKRFTNESGCYDHILHTAYTLPGMTYAMVWDANYIADMQRFDSHGCSRMFDHENGAESVWPLALNEGVFMPMYRDQGLVVKADTIEELAEKLGLPVENFKATVERYNELYDKQEDEDFGKEAYRLSELRTAPFEGVRMSGGYFICTMDGIHINTDMNAVDAEGNPIEGLYVAGDCSGGYFDTSYPNLLAGAAAGRSVTFGRLAGKNAAHR